MRLTNNHVKKREFIGGRLKITNSDKIPYCGCGLKNDYFNKSNKEIERLEKDEPPKVILDDFIPKKNIPKTKVKKIIEKLETPNIKNKDVITEINKLSLLPNFKKEKRKNIVLEF